MKTTTSRTPRIPNVIPSPLLIQCFSPPAPLKGPKNPISNWTTHKSSVPHPCDLPLSQGWETTKPIPVKPVQPTSNPTNSRQRRRHQTPRLQIRQILHHHRRLRLRRIHHPRPS